MDYFKKLNKKMMNETRGNLYEAKLSPTVKKDLADFVTSHRNGLDARKLVIWKSIPKKVRDAILGSDKKIPWDELADRAEKHLSQNESVTESAESQALTALDTFSSRGATYHSLGNMGMFKDPQKVRKQLKIIAAELKKAGVPAVGSGVPMNTWDAGTFTDTSGYDLGAKFKKQALADIKRRAKVAKKHGSKELTAAIDVIQKEIESNLELG